MNLPIVIDIAVGLILIYLMLSLLASEIQELLTTLLQWRAVHLKESIEGFLSGNDPERLREARQLANRLYNHPAIEALNHEAKGAAARAPRLLTRWIPTAVFGKRHSGPAYIASETFAKTLIDTLGVDQLIRQVTVLRIKTQLEHMMGTVDYRQIVPKLNSSIRAYENGRMTLDQVVEQTALDAKEINETLFHQYFATEPQKGYLAGQLGTYVVDVFQASYIYLTLVWRSKLSRRTIELVEESHGSIQDVWTAIKQWKDVPVSLKPTLGLLANAWMLKSESEVNIRALADLPADQLQTRGIKAIDLERIPQAELFYKSLLVHENLNQAMEGSIPISEVERLVQQLRDNEELPDLFDNALDQTLSIMAFVLKEPKIRTMVEHIPLDLLEGLQAPARNLQIKVDDFHQGLSQFQQELATWFDRSVERASGVYKRNARLVAFGVGLFIAISSNADTFHMVNQLAQEQVLRTTVSDLVAKLPATQAFDDQGKPDMSEISALTTDIYPSLPIGWGDRNLHDQAIHDGGAAARSMAPPRSAHSF
jgi:hypothetical protein